MTAPATARTRERSPAMLLIKAVLELRSPGGVASPEQRHGPDGVDLPLARAPFGDDPERLYLPASSLAGSLRAHLRVELDEPSFATVMGGEPGRAGEPEPGTPAPSALRFCGTRVEPAGIVRRTRTAIDRDRAAADEHTLRTSEFLLPGSRITVFLRLDMEKFADHPVDWDDIVTRLLDSLARWAPTIGRGRTTGHGRAVLVELRRRTVDLDTPAGRKVWLTGGGPGLFEEHTTSVAIPVPTEPDPLLSPRWRIVDGLHVGTGERGGRREDGPDVAQVARDQHGRPLVPGSTWKGVLRSRCEFILRSLGAPGCAPTDPACGRCLICTGFGFTGPGRDAPSQRGLLVFSDSTVEGGEVIRQAHAPQDRVFGGVRDGLLFTEEVVRGGEATLTVRTTGAEPVPDGLHALLTLACQDIHHGLVGVGGSTTRGLGTLRRVGDTSDTSDTGEIAAERAKAVASLARHLTAESDESTVEDQ